MWCVYTSEGTIHMVSANPHPYGIYILYTFDSKLCSPARFRVSTIHTWGPMYDIYRKTNLQITTLLYILTTPWSERPLEGPQLTTCFVNSTKHKRLGPLGYSITCKVPTDHYLYIYRFHNPPTYVRRRNLGKIQHDNPRHMYAIGFQFTNSKGHQKLLTKILNPNIRSYLVLITGYPLKRNLTSLQRSASYKPNCPHQPPGTDINSAKGILCYLHSSHQTTLNRVPSQGRGHLKIFQITLIKGVFNSNKICL